MSRIYSTGRDENLENSVGQPLVDLAKVAAKLGDKSMVRTASNKRTKKAGADENAQITALVEKVLQSKKVEDMSYSGGGDGMEAESCGMPGMSGEACGTVSIRPRSAKASISSFGFKDNGFVMPTAEYLEECAAEGDSESYLKALEIRSKVIKAFVQNEARKVEAAKQAREDWRRVVAENLEDEDEDDEEDKDDGDKKPWEKPWEKDDNKKKKASKKVSGFKPAASLSSKEREVVAKKLVALGYSKEAALNYVAESLESKFNIPEHIEKLAQSSLDKNSKTEIFKGFVREAKLESKDRNHLLDYWSNILGYQDKEWCSDLVKDVDPVTGE